MTTLIHYSPEFERSDKWFDTTAKASDLVSSLEDNPVPGVVIVPPAPATLEQVVAVHSRKYVLAVIEGTPEDEATSNGLGYWTATLPTSVLASTGGVIAAVIDAYMNRRNSGSLSSGLHHARRNAGNGYCTFNGLVIAAREAIRLGAKRVLILDLDAHAGGGTASLINGVKGIEQIDVAVSRFDTYNDIPNASLVISSGETYLDDVCEALGRIEDPGSIDVVIYNAGMDPHEDCNTGGSAGITTEVLAAREEIVFDWAASFNVPVAFVLAGGYSNEVLTRAKLAELHRLTVEEAAKPRSTH